MNSKKFRSYTISKSLGFPVEEKNENTIPKIVYDPVNEAQMIKSPNVVQSEESDTVFQDIDLGS